MPRKMPQRRSWLRRTHFGGSGMLLRAGDGFKPGKAGQVFKCAGVSIAFDESGAISELTDSHGHAWAGPGHTLAQLKYRSYSAADVGSFFASYCKSNAGWVQHDYGKPGLPDDVLGKIWTTSMSNLWSKQTADGCKRRLLRVRSCSSFENGRGRVALTRGIAGQAHSSRRRRSSPRPLRSTALRRAGRRWKSWPPIGSKSRSECSCVCNSASRLPLLVCAARWLRAWRSLLFFCVSYS